ncbi:hypothetical protein Pla22_11200 [Rubripirellula amarantea]|uniref:DUF218 domain-containing protein n=1 Tax=Rubripirellula amarantea TaxID=2527999 RepID=A0A5C5WTL5_9BACT|nr:YdcF family protein [Rubripirellula amarantea]TWT53491.1 hypothetical protein Pla22_11200 [Rubripirellula amarantea]
MSSHSIATYFIDSKFIGTMTSSTSPHSPARAFFIASGIAIATAMVIVGATLLLNGTDKATRTATSICMPIGVLWLGLLTLGIAAWLSGHRMTSALFLTLFLFVSITANSAVADRMISLIEWHATKVTATKESPYRMAVVLGGGTSVRAGGTAEVNNEGERLVSAAQLWHAGLTQAIVATGASPDGDYHAKDVTAELLVSLGVPNDVIFKIDGQNTSQEMMYLRALLNDPPARFPEKGTAVLITSAFHMRRAMRLADGQRLDLEPHPVSFSVDRKRDFTPAVIVPTAPAVEQFSVALKEILAEVVGR